jgi:hypothetical protein
MCARGMMTLAATVVIAATATGTTIGCSRAKAKRLPLPPEQARQLLIDRNWIDRLPEHVDDKLHVYRFVPKMGGGVFQDRTLFFGTFELFLFAQDGETIRFDLVHTGEKRTSKFFIEELETPGPEGVDLKLTLTNSPRGPSTYYGWRQQSSGDLDGELKALTDRITKKR